VHWKVYYIQSGLTLKAGFKNEEEAKDWLEHNRPGQEDNYLAEEMDHDEEEEWLTALKAQADEAEDLDGAELEEDNTASDEDLEKGRYTYSTEDDDGDDDDEDLLGEVFGEDEDSDDSIF
jgi:hypothetical protein